MQIGVETSKAVDQRRVFVVDDDEITRAALQFMLHDEIETHELVGLVGELNAKFPGVRILIVCDKADESVAVAGIKAGAHGALVKPLTLEAVRKKVDTILGRGGAAPVVQLGFLK